MSKTIEEIERLVDLDSVIMDNIGPWSERKHELVAAYAQDYSIILTGAQRQYGIKHYYIDGYAGAGIARSKATGKLVLGSPMRVLNVEPRFDRYFFVEQDREKFQLLQKLVAGESGVELIHGDANVVVPGLMDKHVRYGKYERAFVLLDPYNLDSLDWSITARVAADRATDLLHFPTMHAQRNVFLSDPMKTPRASEEQELIRHIGDAQ